MSTEYKHRQTGHLLIFVAMGPAILGAVVAIWANLASKEVDPAGLWICISLVPILVFCLISFYKLTVEVADGVVRFWFGPGLIRKKVLIEDIASCRPVRNRFWHGWGIHYCGKDGWVYNVSGLDAVAIELKSGKKLRIGTDQPQELADAINSALHTMQEQTS